MEIEKKFLMVEDKEVFADFNILNKWKLKEIIDIEQGYVDPQEAYVVARDICKVDILFLIKDARVRKEGKELTLTFKSEGEGDGLKRHKVEIPIEQELFDLLWSKTEGRRVIKTRHIYTDGKYDIKINVYENRGLIVAEVEFPNEEEAAAFESFGKDVTADPKYKNSNLGE